MYSVLHNSKFKNKNYKIKLIITPLCITKINNGPKLSINFTCKNSKQQKPCNNVNSISLIVLSSSSVLQKYLTVSCTCSRGYRKEPLSYRSNLYLSIHFFGKHNKVEKDTTINSNHLWEMNLQGLFSFHVIIQIFLTIITY